MGTKDFGNSFVKSVGDKFEIAYVVDDFKAHRGELFCGIEIISSDRFASLFANNKSVIAINTCRYDYSRRYFKLLCAQLNIPMLNFEQSIRLLDLNGSTDYRQSDWSGELLENYSNIQDLAHNFNDGYSQFVYYSILLFHLTCDQEWILNCAKPYQTLYFRAGLFRLGGNEAFVDCGASIGESTTALIDATNGKFKRSWMIEPDKFNVETLNNFIRKFKGTSIEGKLTLHPCAVGDFDGEVSFNHTGWHGGNIAIDSKGNGNVSMKKIDDILDDVPTIIKMDIEGAELQALKGAENNIKKYTPKLLISAYHKSHDLVEISKLIKKLNPEYRIGLREVDPEFGTGV